MSGWSNLSSELFRVSHNANQAVWASGTGRKSYGGNRQGKPVFIQSGKPKKSRKFHNGIPEGLENDAAGNELETAEMEDGIQGSGFDTETVQANEKHSEKVKKSINKKREKRTLSVKKAAFSENDVKDTKSGRLEQQAAELKARSQEMLSAENSQNSRFQIKDSAGLQEAILWAEILGDPVSVKRRKKRMNPYYGN